MVPVAGDITCDRLGLAHGRYEALAHETTHIVHAAAEIGVNETASQFGRTNVDGTMNMLLFALEAHERGGVDRFVHVSTAYVAGTRQGTVLEDELVDTTFNSLYEHSKFGAEQLVRECASWLPQTIIRPSQIVGDSTPGFAANFNTVYYPLKLYLKGQLPFAPPGNLYVADASLLPRSLGNPPILTIMALATRVAKACNEALGA